MNSSCAPSVISMKSAALMMASTPSQRSSIVKWFLSADIRQAHRCPPESTICSRNSGRLVVVQVALVDDGDLPAVVQPAAQLVHDHRAGSTCAEDEQTLHHGLLATCFSR